MITVSDHQQYVILTIIEPKLDSVNSGMIKTECLHIISQKQKALILNMQHVQFLDSSGLSALLLCYRTAREYDIPLYFVHLNKNPEKIIQIAQLHTIFPIVANITDAIDNIV